MAFRLPLAAAVADSGRTLPLVSPLIDRAIVGAAPGGDAWIILRVQLSTGLGVLQPVDRASLTTSDVSLLRSAKDAAIWHPSRSPRFPRGFDKAVREPVAGTEADCRIPQIDRITARRLAEQPAMRVAVDGPRE